MITEMSRRPESDMCSVRGIGVADIASTSTSRRICRSSSFWATPNRCSSSTTTIPRLPGDHVAREHAVRADQDVDRARLEAGQRRFTSDGGRNRETVSTRDRESRGNAP